MAAVTADGGTRMGPVCRMLILCGGIVLTSSGCETLAESTSETRSTADPVPPRVTSSPPANPVARQPAQPSPPQSRPSIEGITTIVALTATADPLLPSPDVTPVQSVSQPPRQSIALVPPPEPAPLPLSPSASDGWKSTPAASTRPLQVTEAIPVQVQPSVTGVTPFPVHAVPPPPVQVVTWIAAPVNPLPTPARMPPRPPIVVTEREPPLPNR